MEAGDVREFTENLLFQDETVLYRKFIYFFYGFNYDEGKGTYKALVDKFQDDIEHFVEEVYCCEGKTPEECLNRLLEARIWDGRSFYEAEREMTWIDL